MINAVVITLSDRSFNNKREDLSGPVLIDYLKKEFTDIQISYKLLPDDINLIEKLLRELCDKTDLVVTTGGTGVMERDITPDATLKVIEKRLLGFEEVMRLKSFEITPHGIISRGIVGSCGKTLIINLPGSPKAAVENISFISSAIPHTIAKLQGDPREEEIY